MLGLRSLAPRICPYSVDLRADFYQTQEGLKCRGGCLATVVPKDELVEVNLEVGLAHSMVGTDCPPLLEIANGPIGNWDN